MAFLSGLGGVTGGTLTVECPDRTYRFGDPDELDAALTVHDERFFLRALTGNDIGLGESFMDGTDDADLVPLVRLMLRNRRVGEAGARIDVLHADYRELRGRFDKIVSIEMFEAVGLTHYDDYFSAVDRLLAPDGVMFLQTITVDDQWFPQCHGTPDWIEKYIFPGGELASVGEMLASLARTTSLALYHAENCGTHYARTLRGWRARFRRNLARVRALGFDERFIRMWDLYLGSCEATFLERHTGLFQLVLLKNGAQRVLFNEPWSEPATQPHAAGASESAA